MRHLKTSDNQNFKFEVEDTARFDSIKKHALDNKLELTDVETGEVLVEKPEEKKSKKND